ncbi:MAG TPA: hypothetical protein VJ883_11365 [Woeseiaceae bacterium]|nr:hypothetical protein [Woeseiaceae bacterium]
MARPVILFVPGMKPKPEPERHRQQIWRTMLEGVRRADEPVAASMAECGDCLTLADWTWVFYNSRVDIEPDLAAIEELLRKPDPTDDDAAEARSWGKRLKRFAYILGDMLPFLIPHLADERMQVTLQDVRRYLHDVGGIGRQVRRRLEIRLDAAWQEGRPVLLVGHSLGSVIAWDALWELSRVDAHPGRVDLFLTLGSPLGQRFVQRRLKGRDADGTERYPDNIRRWVNIAAIGELTALDRSFRRDYREMLTAGLIEEIEDYEVLNFFRKDGELNVHSEYGYLVNRTTGGVIADWWRSATPV